MGLYYAAGALRVRSDIEVESIGYHSDRFDELLYVGVVVSQTFRHHLSYSATRRADHENNGTVVKLRLDMVLEEGARRRLLRHRSSGREMPGAGGDRREEAEH